ncbi:hypothetical protein DdX_19800 [Ditylenchus destructor]|uniref:Uncharacterized protein n=1 Tax=Ditylenchus destructor TaxID=166010 RepID=A0AAD4QU02_9BILA|nr:hypothetical protein DdX_19800 [Ditylenchus destructor]
MDGEFEATVEDMFSESSVSGISDDQAAEYLANSQVLPEMDTSNTEDGEINTTQDTAGTGDQTQEEGPFLPEIEWISSTRGTEKPFVNGYPFSKDKVSKADPDVVFGSHE